ncbi:hypothetical protein F9U64_20055 [Gracilibacillus oryzae]|uniref:Uncharacterized protein n=1 Tax=Gracilibacillus oryzae TaxID=1672701 RepID=A0A7C8GR48_9BACI|nr:hypothetical protein [Gracilibacillus oryzae]KAB8126361.1 hypothetical protein F9U64_20055 [Gracilibacillus oryzae]
MWKKILFSLLGLVIVGVGLLCYFLFIKEYDIEDEQVDNIIDNEYEITLPESATPPHSTNDPANLENNEGSTKQPDQKSEANMQETYAAEIPSDTNQNENESSSGESVTSEEGDNSAQKGNQDSTPAAGMQPTAERIVAKYEPAFTSLQSQAEVRLNELVSYAYSEYSNKKQSGDNVSYTYLFQKYQSAAARLEANTDAVFNQIYNQLVSELESNGYTESEAQTVYDTYQSLKKARENQLMQQALDQIS